MGISEKLAYLYETKERIKSALNTPYNVYRDYATLIRKYVENQPKSIVEGEQAICENAIDLPCNVDINGNSYQETTEGYQLIDVLSGTLQNTSNNGVTSTLDNDGYITLNGSRNDGSVSSAIPILRNVKGKPISSGTYTLILCDTSGSYSGRIGISFRNATSQMDYIECTNSNIRVKEITLSEEATNMYVLFNGEFSANNFKFKVMLLEGTHTEEKPYEPYTNGASPNTEYKQDIEVIDTVNEFDVSKITPNKAISGGTISDSTVTNISDYMEVKANETYTFKFNYETLLNANDRGYDLYDTNKTLLNAYKYTPTNKGFKVTPSKDGYIRLGYDKNSKDIMFYKGTADLPYLPYGHIGLVQRGINKLDKENNLELGVIGNTIGNDRVLTPSNTRIRTKKPIKVKPNTVYTISVNSGYIISVREYNSEGKIVSASTEWTKSNTFTLTTTITTSSFDILFSRKDHSTITLEEIEWCQFVEGTDKPYEPYIEPIVHSIDLAGNSIALVNEVDKDKLIIGTNGSCRIDKNINSHKCSGSEILNMISNNRIQIKPSVCSDRFSLPDEFYSLNIDKPYIYSNIAKSYYGKPLNQLNTIESGDFVTLWNNPTTGIMFRFNDITTLEDAKAYFDNNDVYVMYKKAETEVIDLPSIEPITLFEGTNVFELVTNLGTTMKVEYIVNAETLQNEITELTNAVIELGGTL